MRVTKGRGTGAGADRRHADAVRALKQFVAVEFATATEVRLHVLGPVRHANAITRAAGFTVSGVQLVVEIGTLRHTLRRHGDHATENQRGQVAVTERDVWRLPQLLAEFDSVTRADASKQGTCQVRLMKQIGHIQFTIFAEVRRKAKQVAFKPRMKHRTKDDASP